MHLACVQHLLVCAILVTHTSYIYIQYLCYILTTYVVILYSVAPRLWFEDWIFVAV